MTTTTETLREACPRCADPACDVPAAHEACKGINWYTESDEADRLHERLGKATRDCAKRPAFDWRAEALRLRTLTTEAAAPPRRETLRRSSEHGGHYSDCIPGLLCHCPLEPTEAAAGTGGVVEPGPPTTDRTFLMDALYEWVDAYDARLAEVRLSMSENPRANMRIGSAVEKLLRVARENRCAWRGAKP